MVKTHAFRPPNRGTASPLYQQIKEVIAAGVKNGHWPPGRKLPSENELVSQLGVSRMTIHRALRELTRDGVLDRVHGVGTFVAERTPHASLIQLRDIADEIRDNGGTHRLEVLRLETIQATPNVAERMAVAPSTTVFHLKAVHFRDDQPIQYEDRYVNPEVAPGFIDADFSQTTATGYLVDLFKPDEMEHVVEALLPNSDLATALKIQPSAPCLKLSRRTWKGRHVVTWVSLFYPGDRYSLGARYATDDYAMR